MQCCTFINCLLLEMAFELKHGATCGNGAITAVVTKEDNDAFSSRADDVFSKLQTRLETTAVPLPSSDEDDEDLHPLCGAKVSNPKKTVLHQHHMVCVFLNMLTLPQCIVPVQVQVDLSVSKHRDTLFQKLDDSSKSPKQPCATSKEPKRREKKVRFAITTSDPDDDGGATKATNDGSARHTGVVTRWDNGRGFGFIKPDQGGKDVFCHVTVIQDGNSLQEGSKVSYVAVYDGRRRKYRAENLTGGVTVDRVRPREVIQALRDESRFTHYSLEGVDVSNSSNTKVSRFFVTRVVLC